MLYKLEDIVRTFTGRTVLDISDLQIEAGLIHVLIGPNGAGKTTLLKLLSFLDKPTTGIMTFQDQKVSFSSKNLQLLRKRVVLVDQNPIMFSGSVLSNVEFGLKVGKVSRAERRVRSLKALDMVGMYDFSNFDARTLSGGETKRVALARALVLQPEVLLCDEPTANVDNENQEIILKIIKKINTTQKTSIIFSTHYLSQSRRLADKTLLLRNGKLSDLGNVNVFRVQAVVQESSVHCQLTGQFNLVLPLSMMPAQLGSIKLNINPETIVYDPKEIHLPDGNYCSGHIVELSQDKGRVHICLDVGVRLFFTLSMQQYRKDLPVIGGKCTIYIPHSSITCSSITE